MTTRILWFLSMTLFYMSCQKHVFFCRKQEKKKSYKFGKQNRGRIVYEFIFGTGLICFTNVCDSI